MIKWGIDLGGTKIECVAINYKDSDFEVLCRKRLSTESEKGYLHILNQIKRLVESVEKEINIKAESIGIGTPGITDKISNTIKNSNVLCLNGQNLCLDLEKLLNITVLHANDANCFALAETKLGAGKNLNPSISIGLILGTGVGSGIVINGKIHEGLQGLGGELGHNYIGNENLSCYCGKTDCIEAYISGTALEKYFHSISGQKMLLKDIQKDFLLGINPNTAKTMERLWFYFGKTLAQIINFIDPEIIILGGGVSNIDSLYQIPNQYIQNFLFNDSLKTPILKHKLGDSAGVIGAALLN